jgi:tetratricopeptide (TPR) repeat protein
MVRAARLLQEWRFAEARLLIAELGTRAPRAEHVRYLQAELAFLDGDYPGALEHIEGLADDAVFGHAGTLRALVTSTYATTRDFARHTTAAGHFVIDYPPGKDEVLVELAGEALEAAYQAIGDDLAVWPDTPVRVEILSVPSDLARVSTLTETEILTTGTIALCKYNKLMIVTPRATLFGYAWMDTLAHEYTHYLVSMASHDNVPVWLQEGLARFEQTRWRAPPQSTLAAVEEHLLAVALRARRLISFDDMHPSMAKLPSQEAAALAFAEVYTLVGFIHDQVGYPGIRAALHAVRDGREARAAVAEVMGRRWAAVERAWKRDLHARELRVAPELAHAASIRFKKTADAEVGENAGVDRVAGDAARALARLGGILRARGLTDAAVIEYEKALALGPDPFLAGKLARTYVELGRHEQAIALAEPLVAIDDGDPGPPTTLGVAHLALGRPDAAVAAFAHALRINPFDPTVRCGLADAYRQLEERALGEREDRACATLRR